MGAAVNYRMDESAWKMLKAMVRAKWPKLADELMPPPKRGESEEDARARQLFGEAFRETVRAYPLSREQVERCLVGWSKRCRWVPKEMELVEMLRFAAYGEKREVAVHEHVKEVVEYKTPPPWLMYARDPDGAIAMYPWLLEPTEVGGKRYERVIDHPMYADAAKRRESVKQEQAAQARRDAERLKRLSASKQEGFA